MQVYRAFFKIIKKNKILLSIYILIPTFFSIAFAKVYEEPVKLNFEDSKTNIAFINKDEESVFVEGLRDFLSQRANIINLPNDKKSIQDALFFREIYYLVQVPEGFTVKLLNGEDPRLLKTTVPGTTAGIFMDNLINKYLNTANLYISGVGGESIGQKELVEHIDKDLSPKAEVILQNPTKEGEHREKTNMFFNILTYAFFSIFVSGISNVILIFNKKDLKDRNLSSPMKLRDRNIQMVLANLSFLIVVWVITMIPGFILYGGYMVSRKGLLYMMNSCIFTLPVLSISLLVGNVIKTPKAIPGISNILANGLCFIAGAFVPQELLDKSVLRIASFTPAYWYILSNNKITAMEEFNFKDLFPIYTNMLVMVAFALAIFALALVIIKQKSLGE